MDADEKQNVVMSPSKRGKKPASSADSSEWSVISSPTIDSIASSQDLDEAEPDEEKDDGLPHPRVSPLRTSATREAPR
jgi:hypothetical protein